MQVIALSQSPRKEGLKELDKQKDGFGGLAELTALMRYSLRGWLDHLHALVGDREPEMTTHKIWDEETELRTTLEGFLFDLDKRDPESPGTMVTGFKLWCKLLSEICGWVVEYNDGITLYDYDRLLPRALEVYSHMPAELLLPASICTMLRCQCDHSRFSEASIGASLFVSRYDWRVRSLPIVIATGEVQAVEWLLQQLRPSPEIPAESLVLTIALLVWRPFDR